MIPKPATEKTGLDAIPWVCLGFFLVYLLIHLTLQRDELQRQVEMADWYQQSGLFELEWENYISWLRISGQVGKAEELTAARGAGDRLTVFRAMAFDPAFERENQLRGDQYWDYQQMQQWQAMREAFRERAGALPGIRFGLTPSAPRPSTYITWHFLHQNLWILLVALLVALPFAWSVEAELGHGRTAALWMVSGVISGLVYVLFLSGEYLPLTGSTPMAAALIGMYLGLFATRKLDFVWFDPRQRAWRTTALPAAVLAPLFLLLPLYEYLGGSLAAHVWLAQLAALLAGAGLVQLARRADVQGAEQREDESDDEERQLRQQLNSAWASMSAMAFTDAERQFQAALASRPGQFLPLTGLYHIHKLQPDSPAFHDIASMALSAEVSDEGFLRQQATLFRDYGKRLGADAVMPLEIRVHMISTLARLGDVRDADRLVSEIEKRGESHPQLARALIQLSQAMQGSNATRSTQLRALATRLADAS